MATFLSTSGTRRCAWTRSGTRRKEAHGVEVVRTVHSLRKFDLPACSDGQHR